MSIVRTVWVLGALSTVPSVLQAQTTVAGSTPGSFRVTESGAAEYRIPIQVPPGIAGMEPKLALVYNSQAGNGPLGVGWNLEGLSAITRCPRTTAQDGVQGAVNYDWNDRYCLDGQRLMAISGIYGADGTEYRTELESFTKMISYGTTGNGPAWFKLWTKSGQIVEYGNTADSRIEAQGKPTARLWAVNKVADTKGNHFDVSYLEDPTAGSFYPAAVRYNANPAAGTQPTATVEFSYQARPDQVPFYAAGSVIRDTQRLALVRASLGAGIVKEYRLAYDYVVNPNSSRIVSLTECDGNGSCLAAVGFTWTDPTAAIMHVPVPGWPEGAWCDRQHLRYGDFNGDGKQDLICHADNGQHIVAFSNGDGTFSSPGWWAQPWCDPAHLEHGDFNGDGKTDLICNADAPDGRHLVAFSQGDGTFASAAAWWPEGVYGGWCDPLHLKYGDFNGDGRQDLICNGDNGQHIVAFSNGDGTFSSPGWWAQPWCDPLHLKYGDFNGDGKLDLICHADNGQHIVAFSNGDGTFSSPGWWAQPWCDPAHLERGDFNGDGKTDLICNADGPDGRHLIAFSKGDGTFVYGGWWPEGVPGGWCYPARLGYGDFNGDGKLDLSCDIDDGHHILAFSLGDGTFASPGWWPLPWCDPSHLERGDFNGDGRTDFICNTDDGRHIVAYHAETTNVISSIANGGSLLATVTYRWLGEPGASIYTRGASVAYPAREAPLSLHVVASTAVSNGIGGTSTTTYRYGDGRIDQSGRGFLGFRWNEATNQQTGLKVRSEFRQDWPYTGMPTLVRKTHGADQALSLQYLIQDCLNPRAPAEPCSIAPGRVYFPYASKNIETGSDLNGALLPAVTTTTSFDAYGNAQGITVSGPGYSKTTTNTYSNDEAKWLLGRLTKSIVASTSDIPPPPPPAGGGGGGGGSPPPSGPQPISIPALMVIVQMLFED